MLANVLVQICCVKASQNKWLFSMLPSPDQNDVYQVSSQLSSLISGQQQVTSSSFTSLSQAPWPSAGLPSSHGPDQVAPAFEREKENFCAGFLHMLSLPGHFVTEFLCFCTVSTCWPGCAASFPSGVPPAARTAAEPPQSSGS